MFGKIGRTASEEVYFGVN